MSTDPAGEVLVRGRDLRRVHEAGPGVRAALDGLTFAVERHEFLALVGRSGAGKSTLLSVMGGLDRGYEGRLELFGRDVRALSDAELAELRGQRIGFVFQAFHLLPHLSVLDNVLAPALFRTRRDLRTRSLSAGGPTDPRERAPWLLAKLGLEGRGGDAPSALSGGQRQRVAIARALLLEPDLLLCDEPTGNLDAATAADVLELFASLHVEGVTVVVATHEPALRARATRTLTLEAGRVVEEARA